MLKRVILPLVGILAGVAVIAFYNNAFLREGPSDNQVIEKINPLPYVVYFDIQSNKPHAVFQTPVFPQYNEYCHKEGKLCQFLPWQQLYADILRISSIQYIGVNLGGNGDKGLYTLLDTLTTVSPFWAYPYSFSQLVVPMQKTVDTGTGAAEIMAIRKQSWENAIKLARKGEYFLCDAEKVASITGMSQEEFIGLVYKKDQHPEYLNPCKSYEIPHYMAFNYFYFLQNAENAAEQYRVSAFHDESPSLTPMMAALVFGRGGEHLKSATLWYDRYAALAESEDDINGDDAKRSLGKAIFEMQLQLITDAADATPECGTSYACLQEKGAIRMSIQNTWNNICKAGKVTDDLRCILVGAGLQTRYMSLNGNLIYPLEENFEFNRSKEYKSRWAQPTG